MKKIWMAAGLAALLVMAGCGQEKTAQSYIGQTSPALSESEQENTQSGKQETDGGEGQESSEDREIGFVFEIEEVFALTGRGTTVTGTVTGGSVKPGDTVYVVKEDGTELETKVVQIEVFGGTPEEAVEGDSVGIELESLEKDQVAGGDRLVGYWGSSADPIVLNPFYTFEVEGIHSVTEDGIVIIGHVQEGNIQTGATASVLTADGAFYESTVKQIEIFDDQAGISTIVEWAGKDITVRVLLEGLEEAEISAGDTMTGYLAAED